MRAVCLAVSGGALVKDAARDNGTTADQIRDWAQSNPAFAALYAQARLDQSHAIAEEAIEIADGIEEKASQRIKAMAGAVADVPEKDKDRILDALAGAAVQRDRLRVDTRKWMASKIAPRLYGEKLEVSGNPDQPLQVQVWHFGAKPVSF